MIRFTVIIFGLFLFMSCYKKSDYLNCYYNNVTTEFKTKEYENLMLSFSDTLNNWIEKGLRHISELKNDYWQIADEVFFNENKDKALLFIQAIDKDTNAVFSSIKIVGAEIINKNWNFYYRSYPIMYYRRESLDKSNEVAFSQMKEDAILSIIKDGYIKLYPCRINYEYIDSEVWFADWMRKKHIAFLNDISIQDTLK